MALLYHSFTELGILAPGIVIGSWDWKGSLKLVEEIYSPPV